MANFWNNKKEEKEMQTLSETARIKISLNNLSSSNDKLTQKQRRELRQSAIINYIKSRPAGERIKLAEFGKRTQMSGDNQVFNLVKHMIADKLIDRYEIAPKQYAYYLPNDPDTKITTPRRMPTVEPDGYESRKVLAQAILDAGIEDASINLASDRKTFEQVEQKAMEFAWKNPDLDVTILHTFIEWINQEK